MRNKIKTNLIRCSALVLFAILILASAFGTRPSVSLYADTTVGDLQLDRTNVSDDLESMETDGVKFDISDYAFNETETTRVILFAEYCYSFYGNKQDNYGLYVYVWNPQGLTFNLRSVLNTISIRFGGDTGTNFTKYPLLYLNQCEKANYEGLFLKFKVNLTGEQKTEIFARLSSDKRIYEVSEIELLTEGAENAPHVTVSTVYTYSGYAKGYGANLSNESTLTYTEEQCDTLENLKVYPTQYRPSAANGKDLTTQDSLHSVYFAIPNDFIATYGELSAVHAQWLDAVTKPALVTGNGAAFDAMKAYLGRDIGNNNENLGYAYLGSHKSSSVAGTSMVSHSGGFCYNLPALWSSNTVAADFRISSLYWLFYSGEGTDSADNYTVTEQMIKDRLRTLTVQYGGELVNDKYSKVLFESVAESFTDVNIERTDEFNLASAAISKSFWDKLFGGNGQITSVTYDGVQAIQPVAETNVTGNKAEDCKSLYISAADYDDFVTFYNENKADSTVYLFRYQVTDYKAEEATLFEKGSFLGAETWTEEDTNAYFFQETVNLDFDVIDVTFSNGAKATVIPVAMTPLDIIPDATPPLDTTSDRANIPWYAYILSAVVILAALFVLRIILVSLCKLPQWAFLLLLLAVVLSSILWFQHFTAWLFALIFK